MVSSSSGINKIIEKEIEDKARSKLSFGDNLSPEEYYGFAMKMKAQLDSLSKNNQRPLKELAVLYKRLSLTCEDQVIPCLFKRQFENIKYAKLVVSVQNQVRNSNERHRAIMIKLSSQGNASSIPGLSQPGLSYGISGGSSGGAAKTTSGSTYGVKSTGMTGGYPSMGSGAGAGAASLSYPSMTGGAVASGGYPSLGGSSQPSTSSAGYGGASISGGYPSIGSTSGGYPSATTSGYGVQQQPVAFSSGASAGYGQYSSAVNPSISKPVTGASPQHAHLRTVICPIEIIAAFLKGSHANTSRKIETCAILAGEERGGKLEITTLIFPTQTGEQDQCAMTDEVELFEVQIEKSVMTIGWIHTHPQFDTFLSSVDVHNQLGYQLQMPEAIAIVYSPIVPQPGYKTFRVRDDMIGTIKNCRQSGFHKHASSHGQKEFEECTHVQYVGGSKVDIIDLRTKSKY